MGQQQLLVILMGIVVTMTTVAIGLQTFTEGQRKANADMMVDDALKLASEVQSWRLQPEPMGGGHGADMTGFSFASTRMQTTGDNEIETANGTFTASYEDGVVSVQGDNEDYDNRIIVAINGRGTECLSTKLTDRSDTDGATPSALDVCIGF